MPEALYFDHHATTPLDPEVLEAMLPWLRGLAANPSSVHAPGRAARKAVEESREAVAAALGASPQEIVFTSGGTESNNLALRGAARAARELDGARGRVVLSAAEHASVFETARALAREGFDVTELTVDSVGLPSDEELDGVLSAPGSPPALVSLILANNETGVVNREIASAARRARKAGTLFHTDAVQAVGKIPVDVRLLDVDLLSLTAHKFGGPKGAGALFVKRGTRLSPLASGGGQEKGRRAGTENVPAIVGLGRAIALAADRLDAEGQRVGGLRDRFEAGVRAAVPNARINGVARDHGPETERLPTASSVTFPGADGETLLAALDLAGIAASSGSACASGTTKPSRVLASIGLSKGDVRSTLRFSFGRTTAEGDVDRLMETLVSLLPRAR